MDDFKNNVILNNNNNDDSLRIQYKLMLTARLAQSAERGANNATVTGSSPVFRITLRNNFLPFFLMM